MRITAVQPRREQDGTFAVNIGVQARRVEDVDAFIEALEARTPFRDVLPVEEQTGDDGLIEAVIDGQYQPERPGAPAAAAGPDATAQRGWKASRRDERAAGHAGAARRSRRTASRSSGWPPAW